MKLFSFKNLAMTGALSVAGLGMIGVGAHAVFTTSTASAQTVTAGTLAVTLSSPGASGDGTLGNPLILPSSPYEGSTFSVANPVTVHNSGNIPAYEASITISATNDNSAASLAMQGELWACLSSGTTVVFNEPLATAIAYGTFTIGAQVLPPDDNYMLTIYAGSAVTGCGSTFTAVSGGAFQNSPTQSVVAGSYNSAASSLNGDAETGVVTPTVTMAFTG